MLVVISPAKRLNWTERSIPTTEPRYQREADVLAGHARRLGVGKLAALMNLSDDLARLNRDRFLAMKDSTDGDSRPAAWAFAGDTYQGLDIASLDRDALSFAERHLRILSGLYGLLRPGDAIRAYRLEMGSRLKTRRGRNLYDFWGDLLARTLAEDAAAAGTDVLVNCASREYFGAVDPDAHGLRVITPQFLDEKDGAFRMVGFHAKRARGAMARFVCERHLTRPDMLLEFDHGGYVHDAERSSPDSPVFVRTEKAAKVA